MMELSRGNHGRRVLGFFGAWLGGGAVLATAGWFAANAATHDGEAPTLVAVALAYLSVLLAVLAVYRPAGMRDELGVWTADGRAFGEALLAWLVALASAGAVYLGVGAATGSPLEPLVDVLRRSTDMARFPHATALDWALIVPRALLLAAVAEELLFRGVLFSWLTKHVPIWAAIVVTAALFAVEHGYYPVLLPIALLFGLALGWLRARTGSIVPGVAIHVLTDGLLLGLALAATAHGVKA
jgi:membrane protease YdiL (CAAX protease family)